MNGFAFVCPHARPDENGAHEINDVMERHDAPSSVDDRVLYCTRCGQAVRLDVALARTGEDPDRPNGDAR
jgi:hypothetical protein